MFIYITKIQNFMEQGKTTLKIYALRGAQVDEIISFLNDLQNAYENLYVFNFIIEDAKLFSKDEIDLIHGHGKNKPLRLSPIKEVREVIMPNERLIINKVSIESPGFWEFLGSINPLQQIREYLKDRHERRKDKEWRERLEEKKMELENLSLQNKIVGERIEILKSIGYSNEGIRRVVSRHLYEPLKKLDKYQDTEMIGSAEIEDNK